MEHFNDSITAGEKGFRNSRSSLVLVPKAKPSAAPNPQQQKESEAQRHTTPLVAQTLEEDEREEKEVQGIWRGISSASLPKDLLHSEVFTFSLSSISSVAYL